MHHRLLHIFLAVAFVAFSLGIVNLIHGDCDEHGGLPDAGCQVCYWLAASVVGIVGAFAFHLFCSAAARFRHFEWTAVPRLIERGRRAPPRGPPLS